VNDPSNNMIQFGGPPGSGLMSLNMCAPENISNTDGIAKCNDKCKGVLQMYADFINTMAGTTVINDPSTELTCHATSFLQNQNDCPDLDPPGVPEPPLNGGPSQYVATLAGNLHTDVQAGSEFGTLNATADTGMAGTMAYTIVPLDRNCPEITGCQLLVSQLSVDIDDFDLVATAGETPVFVHSLRNMNIQNAAWVTGTWFPNGRFQIPANTGRLVVSGADNETLTSFDRFNDNKITGTIDPVTGAVSFDPFSQTESGATSTVTALSGTNVTKPPVAVIGAVPATIECSRPNGAVATLNASGSTSTSGALRLFSWTVNGGPVLAGAQVSAPVSLGTNRVVLNVIDPNFSVGAATTTTTVVDTKPPVIAPTPTLTVGTCNGATIAVTVTPPAVTDVCNPAPSVTGSVISSSPPIPIVNGQVTLPPGTHTIRWTASDGFQTTTATQTVVVQPGVLTSGQLVLDDRAQVVKVGGGFAGVGNAGSVLTQIGNDASIGDILSVAPVRLFDRVTVQGSIRSHGTVTLGNGDNISGSVTSSTTVSLPAVPNLNGVVFPPSTGDRTFNPTNPPGGTTLLAPGSYGIENENSGARVWLSPGDYFFQQLLINTASSTLVIPTNGLVRIFVASGLAYRGQVIYANGQLAQIVLGYNGTSQAVLEAPFIGTLIAPRGQVSIGTATAQVFRGRFFGTNIEVRPGIHLVCDTTVTAQ
jgi:hypothetical protein